eukprot:CAMPEP_0168736634 /NCGR_PEP_ID=MMETSP0724-20121128/9962_1 /TAXON_ID=265536 /ORGANISM="Amphiprora sp., Strain CCMP467" /LENGTH=433 /DNA_ID=CAMNT_0008783839 /DNA_START=31 /DNA_END=1332 /DNA_ORIENTATION=-
MRFFQALLSYGLSATAPSSQLKQHGGRADGGATRTMPMAGSTSKSTTTVLTSTVDEPKPQTRTERSKPSSSSSLMTRKKSKNNNNNKYDPILDWQPPSAEQTRQTRQRVMEPMKRLTSPVFFSTDANGVRQQGLEAVANLYQNRNNNNGNGNHGPILFVSNHQLAGLDSWLVVNQIQESCGEWLRALTAPLLYPSANRNQLDGTSWFEQYGCLPVSTRHFYRLLQTQQSILLFPGGVVEAFVPSPEQAYTLNGWKHDDDDDGSGGGGGGGDFVRTAAKFNATIVPFSSTGAAESVRFWQDVPGLREWVPTAQREWQRRRAPGRGDNRIPRDFRYDSNQRVEIPLLVPKALPSRHYYLFHQPISLKEVDARDRAASAKVYRKIKQSIQRGCQDLLKASNEDPFREPWRRVPYEQVWQTPAPTVSSNVLNELNQF